MFPGDIGLLVSLLFNGERSFDQFSDAYDKHSFANFTGRYDQHNLSVFAGTQAKAREVCPVPLRSCILFDPVWPHQSVLEVRTTVRPSFYPRVRLSVCQLRPCMPRPYCSLAPLYWALYWVACLAGLLTRSLLRYEFSPALNSIHCHYNCIGWVIENKDDKSLTVVCYTLLSVQICCWI